MSPISLPDLLDDLTSLRIDLIVRDEIPAPRMPEWPHAVVDIVQVYCNALKEVREAVWELQPARAPKRFAMAEERESWRGHADLPWVVASPETLVGLRDLAQYLFEERLPALAQEVPDAPAWQDRARWEAKLQRVVSGCDDLLGVLARADDGETPLRLYRKKGQRGAATLGELLPTGTRQGPPAPDLEWQLPEATDLTAKVRSAFDTDTRTLRLDRRGLFTVRKLWELGTEAVQARTTIQLDGDVVTRVLPHVLEEAERSALLFRIHEAGVRTSVGYWKGLVDTALAWFQALSKAGG